MESPSAVGSRPRLSADIRRVLGTHRSLEAALAFHNALLEAARPFIELLISSNGPGELRKPWQGAEPDEILRSIATRLRV